MTLANKKISWLEVIQQFLNSLKYSYSVHNSAPVIEVPFDVDGQTVVVRVMVGKNDFPEKNYVNLFVRFKYSNVQIDSLLKLANSINIMLPFGCLAILDDVGEIHAKYGREIDDQFSSKELDQMIDFVIYLSNLVAKNEKLGKENIQLN